MDENLNELSKRFLESLKALKISGYKLSKEIPEIKQSTLTHIRNGRNEPSKKVIDLFLSKYSEINPVWLLTGKGEMLKDSEVKFYEPENIPPGKRLIPLWDDVSSKGGLGEYSAKMNPESSPAEWIDPGDWFKSATAAIRHYGDSMTEYPPGCILALKEVYEKQLVVWGLDYVIETNEYRITKCVQRGFDKEHITAYSSNTESYLDGRLKHEPLDIEWNDVQRIFLVLGYVVKKGNGTIVHTNQK